MNGLNNNDFILALGILHPDGYEWPDPGLPCPGDTYAEFAEAYGPGCPTEAEVIAARDAALATKEVRQSLNAARAGIADYWRSTAVPPYVRGPYQDKFEAATKLLDAGDVESAAALIEFAEPLASYTTEQAETFEVVKAAMLQGLQSL